MYQFSFKKIIYGSHTLLENLSFIMSNIIFVKIVSSVDFYMKNQTDFLKRKTILGFWGMNLATTSSKLRLHIYSHFVCSTVLNKCMKSLWNYVHYLFGNTHEWSKIYLGILSQYCLYHHWRKSHWNYFYIPENDWMEIMSIWCYTSLIWGYNPFFLWINENI